MTAQPADDSSESPSLGTRAAPQTNRRQRLARLAPLSQQQERVVSRRQLRALGWTGHQIEHEIAFGRWFGPAPGVIALQNAPLTHDQRLWLGVLHGGDEAVLTHLTACRRAGLQWHGDIDTIHVLPRRATWSSPSRASPSTRPVGPTGVGSVRLRPVRRGYPSSTPHC